MSEFSSDNSLDSRSHDVPPQRPILEISASTHMALVSAAVCRICHTSSELENLISPCNCKGSLAFVHLSCLERWLNQSSRSYCELCMFQYNAIETKRYRLWEGLILWIRHPRNRAHVRSDVAIAALLTLVTFGLVGVCLMGMEYFVTESNRFGIHRNWTRNTICLFLAIVILGYFTTIYLLVKDQVLPWYNWWKNTVNVKLLLTPKTTTRHPSKQMPHTSHHM